jgi:hypothetical protein
MPYYNTTLNEIPVRVRAAVVGEYAPATHDDPEEFADVEVVEVWCGGKELPEPFLHVFCEEIKVIECAIACGDLEPDHD